MEFSESRRAEQLLARLAETLTPQQIAAADALANELADTTFRDAQARPATPAPDQPTTFGCED
jgi:hypothetical protein